VQAWVNNLLNTNYETNGYTLGYISGGERISENFYYPAASRYFMGGVTFGF
jgi:iron complex outermembrane receptor protein